MKFEAGKTYTTTATGDSKLVYTIKVTKRTEKTVKVEGYINKTCKLYTNDKGVEWIRTGAYSFAPVFMADEEVCA